VSKYPPLLRWIPSLLPFMGLGAYFGVIGIMEDAQKVSNSSLYLKDIALVWWHHRCGDVKKEITSINAWDEFKRELKKLFYLEVAEYEAKDKLRCFRHQDANLKVCQGVLRPTLGDPKQDRAPHTLLFPRWPPRMGQDEVKEARVVRFSNDNWCCWVLGRIQEGILKRTGQKDPRRRQWW